MNNLGHEVNDWLLRGLDRHVRLAVTGLSRAGKTAFITSLINQLIGGRGFNHLPLLRAAREERLIGCKRTAQQDLMIPRFDYDEALLSLAQAPPIWPQPTRDIGLARLAMRVKPSRGISQYLQDHLTLYVDILDYPGEWLLDLPMLDQSFEQWSQSQFDLLSGPRQSLAAQWLAALSKLPADQHASEDTLAQISLLYTQYLQACQQAGLYWIQPGRFVLPGELAGAPVLQFFPMLPPNNAPSGSLYDILKNRYQSYQSQVVKRFYRDYFSTFDRQVILVDCLQPLNAGQHAFADMQHALEQLTGSFKYGRSSLFRRLFSSKIDKLLFAATKADHVTPEQRSRLTQLLKTTVNQAWSHAAFEGIAIDVMACAAINATRSGQVSPNGRAVPVIQGVPLHDEQPLTLFPGEVPVDLITAWPANNYNFLQFRPPSYCALEPLPHIRMDAALEFLLGDKLR